MVKTYWDVLIVGAGPAGSVAARFLAQAGLDVTVVDRKRFPRHSAPHSPASV
jgi:flavin-dependent dehydrogenase